MRLCPQCNTAYPDQVQRCSRDNQPLTTLDELVPEEKRQTTDVLGEVIGNYRLHTRLGTGGMGSVYQATHLSLGKEAAVKVIREGEELSEQLLERFYREARAVARINHENITQVLDFGYLPDGRTYLAMELLTGRSLEALLQATPRLLPARAIRIAWQICQGLAAAHAQKIIHRDLKPENIFLVQSRGDPEFVKILDFGIAKDIGATENKGLTLGRQLLGTPLYMAPEQGPAVDERTDIYSLGVILYRMTTGVLPIDGENVMELLYHHLSTPPRPPREVAPQIMPSLEAVILKSLAKAKEDRFASVLDLAEALEGCLQEIASSGSDPEDARFAQIALMGMQSAKMALSLTPHSVAIPQGLQKKTPTTLSRVSGEVAAPALSPQKPRRQAFLFGGVGLLALLSGVVVILALLPPKESPLTSAAGAGLAPAAGPTRPLPEADPPAQDPPAQDVEEAKAQPVILIPPPVEEPPPASQVTPPPPVKKTPAPRAKTNVKRPPAQPKEQPKEEPEETGGSFFDEVDANLDTSRKKKKKSLDEVDTGLD